MFELRLEGEKGGRLARILEKNLGKWSSKGRGSEMLGTVKGYKERQDGLAYRTRKRVTGEESRAVNPIDSWKACVFYCCCCSCFG